MDGSGNLLDEQRYMPFGEVRTEIGTITQTDFSFTGQRSISMLSIMDYNARFYDPAIGRFIQPDSIVPNPANPQSWNRFSYTQNNPVRYSDPSGHLRIEEECGMNGEDCGERVPASTGNNPENNRDDENGIRISKNHRSKDGPQPPWIKKLGDGTVLIVMPPGSNPTMSRSEGAKRLGMGLGIAAFLFDIGEMATIFDLLPGDEDLAALADVGVTYFANLFGGQCYFFERPDPSLPYMVTVNQDVVITAGDAGLAGLAKIVGGVTLGPIGYAVGEGADVFTTGASLVYDGNRVFGDLKNYISAGVAVTSIGQINSGDKLILIWP